jgi:hypothetical protein
VAQLGMELSRTSFQTCEACTIGKAKQRNIPKEASRDKGNIFNGRMHHDLLKIKAPDGMEMTINKSNWLIMVDKATRIKRSAFLKTKAGFIEYMCQTMHSKPYEGVQFEFCAKTMQERMVSWSRWPRARTGS